MFEGGASLEACHAVCDSDGGPAEVLLAGIMDRTSLIVVEAGDDAQPRLAMLETVREFAAEHLERSRGARARGTRTTSSSTPSARRRRRRAPTGARGSRGWRASAATCAWRSSACCAPARPRTRCGSRSPSRAPCRGTRTRTTCAAGSQQALDGVPPEPSPRRASALYWDGQLALSQARFAAAEAPLEQALTVAQELGDPALGPPC